MNSHHAIIQELDSIHIISHSVKCNIQDLPNHRSRLSRHNFSVITQNITSVYKNLDDLQVNLSELNFEVDILILTECRLVPNKQIPLIHNYTSYQTTKLLKQNNNHQAKVTKLNLSDATGLQMAWLAAPF